MDPAERLRHMCAVARRGASAHVVGEARRLMSAPLENECRTLYMFSPKRGTMDLEYSILHPPGFHCCIYDHRRPHRQYGVEMVRFADLDSMLDDIELQLRDMEHSTVRMTSTRDIRTYTATPASWDELAEECRRAVAVTRGVTYFTVDETMVNTMFEEGRGFTVGAHCGPDYIQPTTVGSPENAVLAAMRILPRQWTPGDELTVEIRPPRVNLELWNSAPVEEAVRHWASFWDKSKAEFIARTWHPSRMVDWCLDTEEQACVWCLDV